MEKWESFREAKYPEILGFFINKELENDNFFLT